MPTDYFIAFIVGVEQRGPLIVAQTVQLVNNVDHFLLCQAASREVRNLGTPGGELGCV